VSWGSGGEEMVENFSLEAKIKHNTVELRNRVRQVTKDSFGGRTSSSRGPPEFSNQTF
jgi:hypothetical protein